MDDIKTRLFNEITDSPYLLENILNNLITRCKLDLAEDLLKETCVAPHGTLILIFDRLDEKAFVRLAKYFTKKLKEPYWDDEKEEYTSSLGMYLLNKLKHTLVLSGSKLNTRNKMKLWIEENFTILKCPKCSSILTNDAEGNTIYKKACVPLTFNRIVEAFESNSSEHWQEEDQENKYYCSNCDTEVSEVIKNYL